METEAAMTFYCRQAITSKDDPERVTWHKVIWDEAETDQHNAGVSTKTICGRAIGNFHHFTVNEPPDVDLLCEVCFPPTIIDPSEPVRTAIWPSPPEALAGRPSVREDAVYDWPGRTADLAGELSGYKGDVKPFEDVVRAEERFVKRQFAYPSSPVGPFYKAPEEDDRCENEKYQDARGLILDMVEALPSLDREELRRIAWEALKLSDGPTPVKVSMAEYLESQTRSEFIVAAETDGFKIVGKEGWTT
jgi:hypothetical protein